MCYNIPSEMYIPGDLTGYGLFTVLRPLSIRLLFILIVRCSLCR